MKPMNGIHRLKLIPTYHRRRPLRAWVLVPDGADKNAVSTSAGDNQAVAELMVKGGLTQ